MKKVFLSLLLAIIGIASASAQFESGKKYIGTSLNGLNLSYSDSKKFSIGIGGMGGYMVQDDLMIIGDVAFNYHNKDVQTFSIGADMRYYIEQNGIFLQAGTKYVHAFSSYNDFMITPQVGYCFFLNRSLTIEPSVYFDISCTDFSKKSEFGLKIGFGFYFDKIY